MSINVSTASAAMLSGGLVITDMPSDVATVPLVADVRTLGAVAIAPVALDFGDVVVGATSAARTFTVKNTGMTTTGTLAVAIGGAASEFVVASDQCSNAILAPNMTCTGSVTMKPVSAGPKTASLAVSGSPGGTGTASLNGRGAAPTMLTITPASFAFVTTTAGQAGPTQAFTVTDVGDVASSPLTVGLAYASGTQSTELAMTVDGCGGRSLAGMASCTVTVAFNPATFGNKAATLVVNGGPLGAALSGVGQDSVTLTATKSGTGGGTVSGDQINCGSTCIEHVTRTTSAPVIALTAVADGSSRFAGWSGGGCSGTGTCRVTMSQAQAINAAFTRQLSLTVNVRVLGAQTGTLSSVPPGLSCSGTCTSTATFDAGATVVLTVSGLTPGALNAWSNGCTGASCSVVLSAAQAVSFTSTVNNIVFVTSQVTQGNLGGLAGADAICGNSASAAAIPGTFVAFLGTTAASPFSRLGAARAWLRPDGLPFGDTIASIESGFGPLMRAQPVSGCFVSRTDVVRPRVAAG